MKPTTPTPPEVPVPEAAPTTAPAPTTAQSTAPTTALSAAPTDPALPHRVASVSSRPSPVSPAPTPASEEATKNATPDIEAIRRQAFIDGRNDAIREFINNTAMFNPTGENDTARPVNFLGNISPGFWDRPDPLAD